MIKIEKITEDCKADIEGEPIFLGMLINQKQLNRLVVHEGEICYTVNEQEVRYRSSLGDFKEPMLHSAKSIQNLDSAKSTENNSAKSTENNSAKSTENNSAKSTEIFNNVTPKATKALQQEGPEKVVPEEITK
jgi:hypothetical protein